jgi:uncharacterized protein
MIARGPTLAGDGDTPTGSVHILGLPDPAAARAFAFDEPGYQAGVYRDVLLRRWRNMPGRTIRDFPGGRTGGNRYLVLGLGTGPAADLAVPPDRDELVAFGPLLSDNAASWPGTAVLVRARDPDMARAVLTRTVTPAARCTAGSSAGVRHEPRTPQIVLLPGPGDRLAREGSHASGRRMRQCLRSRPAGCGRAPAASPRVSPATAPGARKTADRPAQSCN